MRILLAIHNASTDATSDAAHSMRILMQWLADGGHECRVLGTARFDARPPASIDDHLAALDVPLKRRPPSKIFMRSVKKPANMVVGRPTVDFMLEDVPVTMLFTKASMGPSAERFEMRQFPFLLEDLLRQFTPDVRMANIRSFKNPCAERASVASCASSVCAIAVMKIGCSFGMSTTSSRRVRI